MKCEKCGDEVYWYSATNEDGWRCCRCQHKPGEPPGFSPQLDRDLIAIKVHSILHDMHESNVVYVSSGSMGDGIACMVEKMCVKDQKYDQYSIALFILKVMAPSHAKYWKKVSRGVLSGKDVRNRCHCGALSTRSRGFNGQWEYRCSDHPFTLAVALESLSSS